MTKSCETPRLTRRILATIDFEEKLTNRERFRVARRVVRYFTRKTKR
jgi:hypothetical protein